MLFIFNEMEKESSMMDVNVDFKFFTFLSQVRIALVAEYWLMLPAFTNLWTGMLFDLFNSAPKKNGSVVNECESITVLELTGQNCSILIW